MAEPGYNAAGGGTATAAQIELLQMQLEVQLEHEQEEQIAHFANATVKILRHGKSRQRQL